MLTDGWYSANGLSVALRPLSWIYRGVTALRRAAYRIGVLPSRRVGVPVIVVGNITVGGTGKTPLVIWLVELLKREGYRPGIVSRGYGGQARNWPQQVRPDSDPIMVGDEPVVIARRTQCPMAVAPSRVAAAEALLEYNKVDVIVADDGLQHYALARDIEIAVVDGVRRFGNGWCLPAGPLREPVSRLDRVDFVVVNGGTSMRREFPMAIEAGDLRNVRRDGLTHALARFPERRVHAVAGIGNPDRFFRQLKQLGFSVIEHPFPDHHEYAAADIAFNDELPVVMTEKDAVKCRRFCGENCWYLPISAQLHERLEARLLGMMRSLRSDADGDLQTEPTNNS
jgi:tetraacyldisaccharide 4'-kinase